MNIQNNNISFRSGLTAKMRSEINSCDVKKISAYFQENGIQSDFKGNKVIAWSSLKCLDIMKKLRLGLPKGIFVEDFSLLNVTNKASSGLMNNAPTKLYLNKDIIIPEKTIFFNEFKNSNHSSGNVFWDRLDQISDALYEEHSSATDFFIELILHEFAHAAHEENLIRKITGKKLIRLFNLCLANKNLHNFKYKYKSLLSTISNYASTNPFEAVACDLSKRIINSTDKNSLLPSKDCIKKSPYRKFSLFYTDKNLLEEKLRNFWNGRLID